MLTTETLPRIVFPLSVEAWQSARKPGEEIRADVEFVTQTLVPLTMHLPSLHPRVEVIGECMTPKDHISPIFHISMEKYELSLEIVLAHQQHWELALQFPVFVPVRASWTATPFTPKEFPDEVAAFPSFVDSPAPSQREFRTALKNEYDLFAFFRMLAIPNWF